MNEPETIIESHWVPIAPGDLEQIARALRDRDVFTPTFIASEAERYDPATYRQQEARFDTATRLLIDRNILTRWVAVVLGCEPTAEHRIAAGIMAFAQCANIDVEPNIALYEVAHRFGTEAAREELRSFRFADNAHPGCWAEIALSRASQLAIPEAINVPTTDGEGDFAMPLRRWRRNYILALKLAELELEGGPSAVRMSRLVKWMYDDFLLGGPAIALAAAYLAPNSQRRRLLKGVRSPDRERAIAGIRNAAWDLTLISEFLKAGQDQEAAARLTLLASLDRGLHSLARFVSDIREVEVSSSDRMLELLTGLWGARTGARLAGEIGELYATLEASHRQLNRDVAPDFIDRSIARGEQKVRDWAPRAEA